MPPTPPTSGSLNKGRLTRSENDDDGCGDGGPTPGPAAKTDGQRQQQQQLAPITLRPSQKLSTTILKFLAKPVFFVVPSNKPADQLPADVQPLLEHILRITRSQSGFIPHAARKIIQKEVPDGKEWPTRYFQKPDGQKASNQAARRQFDALCQIEAQAKESANRVRGELAWNNLVHSPLLELATSATSGVICEPVMGTGIYGRWLPDMAAEHKDVAAGKMVDYALVLDLDGPCPTDSRLAAAVLKLIGRQPDGDETINQSNYEPLALNPIGVSIETKRQANPNEGTVQLGVWTAAWHRRVKDLLVICCPERIITLPLILCHGHDWSLYFACDRGQRIDIVGPFLLGRTDQLCSLYSLFGVLVELCKWVKGPYRQWWMDKLGIKENAGVSGGNGGEGDEDLEEAIS